MTGLYSGQSNSSFGAGNAVADGNTVTMASGRLSVDELVAGYAVSSGGDASASNNSILITGGTLANYSGMRTSIKGAHASQGNQTVDSTTTASNNGVKLQNVNFSGLSGLSFVEVASANVSGGYNVVASNNSLLFENVSTSDVTGLMYIGLCAVSVDNASSEVNISGNNVYLGSYSGFTNGAIGAVSVTYSANATINLTNNAVYVYGTSDLSTATIMGVFVSDSAGATVSASGNTLYFGYNNTPWTSSGDYSIRGINGFDNITFKNAVWGKTITVTDFGGAITGNESFTGTTSVDATKVAFSGVDNLSVGDSYKMMTITKVNEGNIGLTSTSSTYTIGTAIEGTGTVSLADNNGDGVNDTVVYTIAQPDNPGGGGSDSDWPVAAQAHNAAMAHSAATVALNQGADTSSAAIYNLANSGVSGIQAFSSVGGGTARVETGSHVTFNSLNFSVGVGNNRDTDYGLFSFGGAFEAGYGRFKNHFDAGSADPFIKKSGHASYYGLAVMTNLAMQNLWHVNAALRFGKMSSKQSDGLYDAGAKRNYDIDIDAYYIGVELGGGKIIKIDESNSIDLYGKYFFLYQDSDSFNAGADKYMLDSVTSHRLRLAGRYLHSFNARTTLYAGLGAEYEFDGKAKEKVRTSVGTFNVKASEMDGLRAYLEAGVCISPENTKGLSFDLGVKGLYGSDYRGAWLNAEVKYSF